MKLSLKWLNGAVATVSLVALTSSSVLAQRPLANPQAITAAHLKSFLTFIASDEMEGRNTPSRGLDTAALFIAEHLENWGLKPMGDNGTYFQKISLTRPRVVTDKCSLTVGGSALKYGEDYYCDRVSGTAQGPLVFGGFGWLVKAKNIDAYAGMDVKGKIAVLVPGPRTAPPGLGASDLTGTEGTDYADPVAYAKSKGIAGIIYLSTSQTSSSWTRNRAAREGTNGGYRFEGKPREGVTTAAGMPVVYLSEKSSASLLSGEKLKLTDVYKAIEDEKLLAGFSFPDAKSGEIKTAADEGRVYTQNVVAVVEGSDPVLKNEYVVCSAHYDHVGLNSNPNAVDKVYNGADDDGSGTVSIMGIAEALSRAPKKPKRSVLFVWHCGEEKGLWGSDFYTNYPTVPLKNIIADLNIDMIGRSKKPGDTNPANRVLTGPDEIYVIGSKMQSTQLGDISEKVNSEYLKLSFNYKYDDPKDTERIFYRSDHYNYARKGIPIIFYFDGVHEDYHQLGDEVSKIDFQKMEKVVRTVYLTMWELTGLPQRLVVDKVLK